MELDRLLRNTNGISGVEMFDKYVIKQNNKEEPTVEESDAVVDDIKYDKENADVSFQIVEISGKGTGLVAIKKLFPGDLIMFEKPLIVVPDDIYDDLEKVAKYLDKVVNRLSCPERELFFNLTDCRTPDDPTYLGIFDTNDMNFGGDAAIFPQMARANHSCQPNAEFVTDDIRKIQKLVAIDIIDKGEEITINYLSMEEEGTDTKEKRQKFLKKWYGFTCTCRVCSKEVEK